MGYLFMHGPEDYRRPASGGACRPTPHTPKIEKADRALVAIFMGLQNAWRRQGTLRRTFNGMPSSQEEREGWKQLIQYLTKLPPPRS
jgi:hypothetical protein